MRLRLCVLAALLLLVPTVGLMLAPDRASFEFTFVLLVVSVAAFGLAAYLLMLAGRRGRPLRAGVSVRLGRALVCLLGCSLLLPGVLLTGGGLRLLFDYLFRPGLRNEFSGAFIGLPVIALPLVGAGVVVLIAAGTFGVEPQRHPGEENAS